jgi:hypothetical protein
MVWSRVKTMQFSSTILLGTVNSVAVIEARTEDEKSGLHSSFPFALQLHYFPSFIFKRKFEIRFEE